MNGRNVTQHYNYFNLGANAKNNTVNFKSYTNEENTHEFNSIQGYPLKKKLMTLQITQVKA